MAGAPAYHVDSTLPAARYCQARTFDAKNFKLIVKRYTFAGIKPGEELLKRRQLIQQ
jgi:hypothetical protein